jgi:effector-binding domain-containing protein
MLRSYHDAGILVPSHVDARTGYRSYGASQLTDAGVIRRLRLLDVSLDDVRKVLQARDPDVTKAVLALHATTMSERLMRTERIIADLQRGLAEPGAHTPVRTTRVPTQLVLAYQGDVAREDYSSFLDVAFGALFETLQTAGLVPVAAAGAQYPSEILTDIGEHIVAYVPVDPSIASIDNLAPGLSLVSLPSVTVAVSTHTGSYDDIGSAYAALGLWVAEQATMSGDPVREVYLVSPPFHNDPETYVTELQWPIQPKENS